MHLLNWLQQNGTGLFWAVLIFALMVFIHEFGHFLMAKRVGVKVLEFALGFGQRIFGWKRGDTEYAVRLFPLGGYVKMLGEGDEGDPNDPGHFQNKSVLQRMAVVAAGPVMNYFLAILLLFALAASSGVSYVFQILDTSPNMPAARAGLQRGDQILSINGQGYRSFNDPEKVVADVVSRIRGSANVPLDLEVRRGAEVFHVHATPQYNEKEKAGLLGIAPFYQVVFEGGGGLGQGLASSLYSTWYFTKAPFVVIGEIFQGKRKASDLAQGSAGPVGMGHFIILSYNRYQKTGQVLQHLVWLAALLNIFIGLFNLFPIPALDGSRLFFMGLGALFGKPLNPKLEEGIHLAGFAFLLILMVLVTFQDISRIIKHTGF